MIIVNIYGGLGNQMFQYALGKNIAQTKQEKLIIDNSLFKSYELRDFLLNRFNIITNYTPVHFIPKFCINNRYLRKILQVFNRNLHLKVPIYFEKKEFTFDKNVFTTNSKYFYGYWQSYKYLESIRDILLKEFTLKEKLDDKNLKVLNEIRNLNSVSIHIRRGDYIMASKLTKGHGVQPITYYERAIELISTKIENPTFFVFSDDIDWVKENMNIPFPNIFIDFNNNHPEKDMILMRNCKHNVIANSTFSWWGAWLNENQKKIVIAPKKWMNNLNTPEELVPKTWITL